MEDLVCLEEYSGSSVRQAPADPTILSDDRILINLLATEDSYRPSLAYFKFQKEILPFMRKAVVTWLLEVCEEQKREDDVFPLTVNLLDRVLSTVQVKKSRLQLVATVCLHIASKVKECWPIDPQNLVMYTDYSITINELLDWEMMILQVLKWDTSAVIPNDFLLPFLHRLPVPQHCHQCVLRHSTTFITLCAIDFTLASQPASIIAASSLLAAIRGVMPSLASQDQLHTLLHTLHLYTGIDIEYIRTCASQIELTLANNLPHEQSTDLSSSPLHKPLESDAPPTPTDVLDVIVAS